MPVKRPVRKAARAVPLAETEDKLTTERLTLALCQQTELAAKARRQRDRILLAIGTLVNYLEENEYSDHGQYLDPATIEFVKNEYYAVALRGDENV